jgi:hypothetical protein
MRYRFFAPANCDVEFEVRECEAETTADPDTCSCDVSKYDMEAMAARLDKLEMQLAGSDIGSLESTVNDVLNGVTTMQQCISKMVLPGTDMTTKMPYESTKMEYDTTKMEYPETTKMEYPETTKMEYPETTKMEYPETTKMEYPETTKMEYPETTEMDYETTMKAIETTMMKYETTKMEYPETTMEEETTMMETTMKETTMMETTMADTTMMETTMKETTMMETTMADTTMMATTEEIIPTEVYEMYGYLDEATTGNKCAWGSSRTFKIGFTSLENCVKRCYDDTNCKYATTEKQDYCIGCKVAPSDKADGWYSYKTYQRRRKLTAQEALKVENAALRARLEELTRN